MKTIGLIGGTSWESTREYYRIMNELVKERLGGIHSAKCLLYSVEFAELMELQQRGGWEDVGTWFAEIAANLERAGADMILLCANTTHIVAPQVEDAISIPLVHMVDVTAAAIQERGFSRVGLLGTTYTMEHDFYKERLRQRHGLDVLIPGNGDRAEVHRIIAEELTRGEINESARQTYLEVIDDLVRRGAEGVILGCTEIPLLIDSSHTDVPLFDTTEIHATAAVDLALRGES